MSKAKNILEIFYSVGINEAKLIKFDPEKSFDKNMYMQIVDQMKQGGSSYKTNIWYPVILNNDGKKKQIEAMSPNQGNLMFRTARKPEIFEDEKFYRIVYDLYKFSNKGVIQNPVTSYQNFSSKEELMKALEPFKK